MKMQMVILMRWRILFTWQLLLVLQSGMHESEVLSTVVKPFNSCIDFSIKTNHTIQHIVSTKLGSMDSDTDMGQRYYTDRRHGNIS